MINNSSDEKRKKILQMKREKRCEIYLKTNRAFFARWLDGVVIDFYFNYMFQQMF